MNADQRGRVGPRDEDELVGLSEPPIGDVFSNRKPTDVDEEIPRAWFLRKIQHVRDRRMVGRRGRFGSNENVEPTRQPL
ncbi:MAG: hypothetical protein WB565_12570 [Acidimicrobiales bacterium]